MQPGTLLDHSATFRASIAACAFRRHLSGVRKRTCALPSCPVDLNAHARMQVRSDCSPETLQEFLASDTADEAEETAISLYNQEDEEAALLEEVCRTRHRPKHRSERRLQLAQPRRVGCRSVVTRYSDLLAPGF